MTQETNIFKKIEKLKEDLSNKQKGHPKINPMVYFTKKTRLSQNDGYSR